MPIRTFARRNRRFAACLAVVTAVLLAAATPAAAAEDLVLGVDIVEREGAVEIVIGLAAPRRIVTYVPERRGATVDIRIVPLVPVGELGRSRETIPYRVGNAAGLEQVAYEPEPDGGGSLLVRFRGETEFHVAVASDLRSIVVTIPKVVASDAIVHATTDLERAKEAIVAGEYAKAIRLLEALLAVPGAHAADATELLGLARERNGDFAGAEQAYTAYLEDFPDGAGAARVRQRLQALETRTGAAPQPLRAPSAAGGVVEWSARGFVSQYYRYDGTVSDEDDALLSQSALDSDVALTATRRTSLSEIRARVTGGYYGNFRHGSESELDVDEAYVEMRGWDRRVQGAVGRQARSSGGVLGRLDGGLVGIRVTPWLRWNLVGGFADPYTTDDDVDTERPVYGLEADIGPFLGGWSGSLYGIEQRIDGLVDRRAVGGELRYADRRWSGFGLVDYDLYFDELNTGLALVTYTFEGGTSLTGSYDHRLTPVLTTSNALQGQTADDVDELRDTYSASELRDLARDRTATSDSAAISGSVPVGENLRFAGDVTWFRLSGLDAAGGVEATPGTGDEVFATVQMIGSDWLGWHDIVTTALRYADTHEWDSVGTSIIARIPFGGDWRAQPRLLVDYRMLDDGGDQLVLRPSTRLEWTWRSRLTLELEGGCEWVENDADASEDSPFGYFVSAGYRWDF